MVADSLSIFQEGVAKQDWDSVINACSMVSVFVEIFPERTVDFQALIVPLIKIVSEKVDALRKTAAVCLAKLAKNEENSAVMRANHGHEVLVSLGGVFSK